MTYIAKFKPLFTMDWNVTVDITMQTTNASETDDIKTQAMFYLTYKIGTSRISSMHFICRNCNVLNSITGPNIA